VFFAAWCDDVHLRTLERSGSVVIFGEGEGEGEGEGAGVGSSAAAAL
jgi:hypothetical protein